MPVSKWPEGTTKKNLTALRLTNFQRWLIEDLADEKGLQLPDMIRLCLTYGVGQLYDRPAEELKQLAEKFDRLYARKDREIDAAIDVRVRKVLERGKKKQNA